MLHFHITRYFHIFYTLFAYNTIVSHFLITIVITFSLYKSIIIVLLQHTLRSEILPIALSEMQQEFCKMQI